MEASNKWNIPPAHITSHIRANGAPDARRWVMREMVDTLGMKRCQVAWAFGVDLRRVRASEIGGKRTGHGKPGGSSACLEGKRDRKEVCADVRGVS